MIKWFKEKDPSRLAPSGSSARPVTEISTLVEKILLDHRENEHRVFLISSASERDCVNRVGHILGEIPALADKESISDEDKAAIKSAVEDLFEGFGELDDKMHGGEGATYEEVADKIAQAMATLKKHAGPQETE